MNQATNIERQEQTAIKLIISLIILVLTIALVVGEVTLTSITAPTNIDEGETLSVSFTATTDENESVNYYIEKDGVNVAATNSYDWETNYTSAGTYEFTFIANTSNNEVSDTRTITVNNDPVSITIDSPGEQTYNSSSITITVQSEQSDTCSYDLNNTETGLLTKNGDTFSKETTAQEGSSSLEINCSNIEESSVESVEFTIDTTKPQITDAGPTNAYENPIIGSIVTLDAVTNEDAVCKYSATDELYDDMSNTFSNTNAKNHYQTLTGLSEREHTYFITCKDIIGNLMDTTTEISFYTNKKPTARVNIDSSSPLKAGQYEVTITTSEDMQSEPTLQYNFHNSAGKKPISLTGSGKNWEGFLIIDDSTSDSIGTFYFSGKDISGLSGDEITSGKLFLVDTQPPASIDSLEVNQQKERLLLEWHYVGEEVDKFLIYKTTEPSVTYNDYYASSEKTSFEDSDVDEGVTYYYKVSAIDEADNEGLLSTQVEGIVEPELKDAKTLAPSLVVKVNQKINKIDSSLLDVDWSEKNLENEKDADKTEVITKLSLLEKTRAIKSNLERLKNDLEKLKNLDLTKDGLDKRISKIDLSYDSQVNEIIKSVSINEKLEYTQSFDEGDYKASLNDFFLYYNIEDEKITSLNKDLQSKVNVDGKIIVAEIEYLETLNTKKKTIISKTITSSEVLEKVSIVETIPKNVEDNSDDIIFSKAPKVLKKDPVVEWELTSLTSHKIYYVIEGEVDLTNGRNTRTDVFVKSLPKEEVEDTSENTSSENEITGFATGDQEATASLITALMIIGVLIISGLLTYYFFFLKEDEVETKVEVPRIVNKPLSNKGFSTATQLVLLLDEANKKADKLDFEAVTKIYHSVISLQTQCHFINEESKQKALNEINNLYSKIVLFHKLKEASHLLESNNIMDLKKNLQETSKIMNIHRDNSKFFNNMESLYNHLIISTTSSKNRN